MNKQLTLESLNPELAVYEPGSEATAIAANDCSDCNVLADGIETAITDYTISVGIDADITNPENNTDKFPVFLIPNQTCKSSQPNCSIEISLKQGSTESNSLTIAVRNTSYNPGEQCPNGEAKVNGICPNVNCPEDTILENGQCVPVEVPCSTDQECGANKICSNGLCEDKPPIPGGCADNTECSAESTCVNHLCKKNDTPLDTTKDSDKRKAYNAFTDVVRTNNNTYSCKADEVLWGKECITTKACQDKMMGVVTDTSDNSRKYCFCNEGLFEIPQADGGIVCKSKMAEEDRTAVIDNARAGGDRGTYWRHRMDQHEDDAGYQEAMGEAVIENGMAKRSGANPNVTLIERNKPDGRTDRSGVTPEGQVIVKPNLNIPGANKKGFESLIEYAGSVKGANECTDGSGLGPNKECVSAEECAAASGEIVSDRMNGAICLCQDGFSFGDASRDLVCKQLDEITEEDYRNRTRNLRTGGRTTTWEGAAAKDNEEKDDSGTYVGGLVAVAVNMDVLWDIKLTGAPIVVPQPGYDNVPKKGPKAFEEAIEKKKKEYLENRFCSFDIEKIMNEAKTVCLGTMSDAECKKIDGNVKAATDLYEFMENNCAKIKLDERYYGTEAGTAINPTSVTDLECKGSNEAITGIQFKYGMVLDSLQIQCTSVESLHNNPAKYPETLSAPVGGSGGSSIKKLESARGFGITGFNVRRTLSDDDNFKSYGQIVKDIQLVGNRLKPWGPEDRIVWRSHWLSEDDASFVSDGGYCPGQELMTGLKIKHGKFIQSITPICHPTISQMKPIEINNSIHVTLATVHAGQTHANENQTIISFDNDDKGQIKKYDCPYPEGLSCLSINPAACNYQKGKYECGGFNSAERALTIDNTTCSTTPHKVSTLKSLCDEAERDNSERENVIAAPDGVIVGLRANRYANSIVPNLTLIKGFQFIVAPFDGSAKRTDNDPALIADMLYPSKWIGNTHLVYETSVDKGWIAPKNLSYLGTNNEVLCPSQQRLTGIEFSHHLMTDQLAGIKSITCKRIYGSEPK